MEKHLPGIFATVAAFALAFPAAAAECKIKEWKAEQSSSQVSRITGTTTCNSGSIAIEVYDASSKKLVGEARTYFSGGRFSVPVRIPDLPENVTIEYKIR